MKRYVLLAVIGLALGLGIPLFYGGTELFRRLAMFPLPLLAMVLAMVFVGWNFNAGRLRLMLGGIGHPMAHGRALATVMATEFAICATPVGSGGPVAFLFLLRRHGVSGASAAALYALDILLDMLFFVTALLVIAVVLLFQPERLHVGWQLGLLAGLLGGGLVLAWAAVRHYRPLVLGSGRLLRLLRASAATRRRFARKVLRFRQALGVMFRLSRWRLLATYLMCVGHWLMRYSILYVLIVGLGRQISWAYSFLVQMLALSTGQLTLLPGGSGGVEVAFTVLLARSLDKPTLAAVLLMWRFTTYYWYLIAGAPVFAVMAGKALWRRLETGEEEAAEAEASR